MPKVSQQPTDSSPSLLDYLLGNQNSGPVTKVFSLQTLINFFWTLANIPSGGTSPITRDNEAQFPFVASGLVWTADAAGSTRNASMTAGVCYINGRRISIAAVTARTFTASVDTYVDVLDNGDGTGTLVYTTATNNAASPSLAANSIRIGIIVTGATNIAAASSINQGQVDRVLPIASSTPYAVTDSLGNLICPRDPGSKMVGFRQVTVAFVTSSTTNILITGLAMCINVTAAMVGRKLNISSVPYATVAASGAYGENRIFTGASLGALTTQVGAGQFGASTGSAPAIDAKAVINLTAAGPLFIAVGTISSAGGSTTVYGGTTSPHYLIAELE